MKWPPRSVASRNSLPPRGLCAAAPNLQCRFGRHAEGLRLAARRLRPGEAGSAALAEEYGSAAAHLGSVWKTSGGPSAQSLEFQRPNNRRKAFPDSRPPETNYANFDC